MELYQVTRLVCCCVTKIKGIFGKLSVWYCLSLFQEYRAELCQVVTLVLSVVVLGTYSGTWPSCQSGIVCRCFRNIQRNMAKLSLWYCLSLLQEHRAETCQVIRLYCMSLFLAQRVENTLSDWCCLSLFQWHRVELTLSVWYCLSLFQGQSGTMPSYRTGIINRCFRNVH